MENSLRWVVMGRFGRVHGIKGFITLHSHAEQRNTILNYTPLYAFINNQWQEIELEEVVITNKHILVRVAGYNERERVAYLTNCDIAITKEQLPDLPADEFYWHQLMGMKVINQKGELLGTVCEMMPTGANDVLIVTGEKRFLIPYLPGRTVINVDTQQQTIEVDWDSDF